MLKNNISIAKKIVADLVKREEYLTNAMVSIRDLFESKYGPLEKTIGVFGREKTTMTTLEGDIPGIDLIQKVGIDFAKKDFIVITGEYIFFKKERMIFKCNFLQEKIREAFISSQESLSDFSRCLAAIPRLAISLLSQDRSSSQKEEEEFFKDRFDDNEICVNILFLKEDPRGCSKLLDNENHHLCDNDDFNLCNEQKCPFIHQGSIPAGEMEIFVKSKLSRRIILKSHKEIPKIIASLRYAQ